MPSKKQYDLVQNDDYDTRIPLHQEEAFHHGIPFQAKFIGSLDVSRPTSRVEIVAAMRRIRYEFKAKGIKKRKVNIEISVDGIRVTLRKKKKRKQWPEDEKSNLLSHPIYRIFYVSHDSQDMKIFSYIAREGSSNIFKCAVFKANKKSQAMRVVRTIGQAFEVCHKLSITAPENIEYDEQETLTQDLLSDRVSDVFSDKSKRDFQSEPDTDRISLPDCDNSSLKELQENKTSRPTKLRQLESLPPPPSSSNNASSLISAETYSSPHSDLLTTDSSVATHSLPSSGSALSAHHEMQLLREQLDQQSQQTQAAMAQLQLAREQLAAEQTARMEAQSRTHQLLVHNRELLDHIAALVSHLQGGSEKSGLAGTHQQNAANLTLPQTRASSAPETYMSDMSELLMDKGSYQDLIENRMVTSCLPPSPLNVLSPTGGMFNFQYPPEASYESQLLQNMQPLGGYNPNPYHFNFNPVMPYFSSPYYPPPNMLNKSYTLPHPSHKFASAPINARHSYMENQIHVPRPSSEPRQATHQYHSNTNLHFTQPANSIHLQNYSQPFQESFKEKQQNPHSLSNQLTSPTLTQNAKDSPLRGASPRPSSLIKPLPQVGTITTTDADGKVRVIVPVPSSTTNKINNKNDAEGLLANLKLTDDFRMNGPPIQRSTSEKVPNRSELLSQVQRAMWARHTTK